MNVKILTHGDADGICAGALALAKYPDAEVWFTHPAGLLNDMKDIEDYEVFVLDVGISERDKDAIFNEMLRLKEHSEVTYIDHHPLPVKTLSTDLPCTRVVRDLTKSASELTFKYFGKGVDHLNRIALYGAISDYCDETDFVREELCFYDKRTIYLEAGLLSQSLGESRSDYGFKREIMKNLASGKEPNSIPGVVENAINSAKKEWVVYERIKDIVRVVGDLAIIDNVEKGVSAGKAAKFSIGITEKNIGVGIRVRHDFADISVRKKGNFPMDLDLVLRSIAFRLGGSGGGHASAAGARIPSRNIDEFIRTLADEVASIS